MRYWSILVLVGLLVLSGSVCTSSRRPGAPVPCWDRFETVLPGTECRLTALVVDPDGDSCSCRFAWGDGDTSDWSSFVASGRIVTMLHRFVADGVYGVSIQALDGRGRYSDWSLPEPLLVGDVHPVLWSWAPPSGEELLSAPVVMPTGTGEVVVVCAQYEVAAFDPKGVRAGTGVSADPSFGGVFNCQPVFSGASGHLLAGNDEGELYAFGQNMTRVWHWPGNWNGDMFDELPWGTAAADGDRLYVAREEDAPYTVLHCLEDMGDFGLVVARCSLPDVEAEVCVSPVIDSDGNVVWCTSDGALCKYAPGLTRLLWSVTVSDGAAVGLAVGRDDEVYVATDCELTAWSAGGELLWGLPIACATGVAVGESLVFVVDDEPRVLAARADNGMLVWAETLPGSAGVVTPPLLTANGLLYLLDGDGGVLYCRRQSDGVAKWETALPWAGAGRDYEEQCYGLALTSEGDIVAAGYGGLALVRGYPDGQLADTPWPKFQHDNQNTGCARTAIPASCAGQTVSAVE